MNRTTSRLSVELHRYVFNVLMVCILCVNFLFGQVALTQTRQNTTKSKDEKFAGEAAWQIDEELGKKWQEITGRFIFQRTCLSCHQQGPSSFTKAEWQEKLKEFPDDKHIVLLPKEFADLTAKFSYGRMTADDQARFQSLAAFVLKYAPENKANVSEGELQNTVDLLPTVGQAAPDFSIVDSQGNEHSLQSYIRNKEALILVFSRAHW